MSLILSELARLVVYIIAVAIGLIWAIRYFTNQGKKEERADQYEETLNNLEKAKKARDSLSDPDKRDDVRKLFTRSDK